MSHVLGFSFCRVQFHFLRICRHPSHFLLKENYLLQEKKKGEWYKSALWQVPHFFCFFSVRDPSIVIIGTFPSSSASGVQCVCNPPCEHAVQSLTPKALISCCEIWLWDPERRQTFRIEHIFINQTYNSWPDNRKGITWHLLKQILYENCL